MTGHPAARRTAMLLFASMLLSPALPAIAAGPGSGNGAWAFSLTRIEGGELPLEEFDGHPVLLVNTASMCGFTYQYDGLQKLWDDYRERGLIVLGVPSGDFGGQEYDSSGEIKTFCETNFALDFPLAGKEHVRGENAHPLYRWLAETLGPSAVPGWNFHKILIGADGMPVAAWGSRTEPGDPAVTAAIEAALQHSGKPQPGAG